MKRFSPKPAQPAAPGMQPPMKAPVPAQAKKRPPFAKKPGAAVGKKPTPPVPGIRGIKA